MTKSETNQLEDLRNDINLSARMANLEKALARWEVAFSGIDGKNGFRSDVRNIKKTLDEHIKADLENKKTVDAMVTEQNTNDKKYNKYLKIWPIVLSPLGVAAIIVLEIIK